MKKFLSFLILLAHCLTVQSQKIPTSAVPKTVIEAFKKSHPTAIAITWTQYEKHYEVKFEVNNKTKSLMYNTKGILVFNEAKVAITTLPATAKRYMDTLSFTMFIQ